MHSFSHFGSQLAATQHPQFLAQATNAIAGRFAMACVVVCCLRVAAAEPTQVLPIGSTYETRDSLDPQKASSPDAAECLGGLCWSPGGFRVQCERPASDDAGDALVRFPSPLPVGDAINDLVALEWYVARDANGNVLSAPAVVVVHESGSRMSVGRLFARGLRQRGLHAFMLQLPFYGERRPPGVAIRDVRQLKAFPQGIADTRRAFDAVRTLPFVDGASVSLQGTSLGGFVVATTAGIDRAYDNVFVMLAGGDLYAVINEGQRDAAKARQRLLDAGLSEIEIRELARSIEPNRLAHRVDPSTTWLFAATHDQVVPPASSLAFAEAAGLPKSHHVRMYADHYTGALYVPVVLDQLAKLITEQ